MRPPPQAVLPITTHADAGAMTRKPHSRSVILGLAVLLFVSGAISQTKPVKAHPWLQISSPDFVITTDAGERQGRELALYFEQMRILFGDLVLHGKRPQGRPVQIIA